MRTTESHGAPRFLNLHILVSHGPSVMNRDDLGLHKAVRFGGKRRLRLSSQCLKRAVRTSDLYVSYFGPESIRTREVDRLLALCLEQLGSRFGEETVRRAIAAIAGLQRIEPGDRASAVAPWTIDEVADACEAIKAAGPAPLGEDAGEEPKAKGKGKGKGKGKTGNGDGSDEAIVSRALAENRPGRTTVDIAMGGRFSTTGAMTDIDGALYMSHALTTHAADDEVDWFAAMDDLAGETTGRAGHLDQTSFGTGVFYKFAVIDIPQLARTLSVTREEALDAAAKYAELVAVVSPGGKQHSFASFSPPDYVAASFERVSINGANAFECPVNRDRQGGFLAPSIAAFEDFMTRTRRGLSRSSDLGVYTPWSSGATPRFERLSELLDWIRSDPEAGA